MRWSPTETVFDYFGALWNPKQILFDVSGTLWRPAEHYFLLEPHGALLSPTELDLAAMEPYGNPGGFVWNPMEV